MKIELKSIKDAKPRATGANRGGASRMRDYREVYAATRDHRSAVRSYCAGNKWATENAKAVGNW